MASILIIDQWRRSPVARVTQQRIVMVVADTWAEQRVLMRAFHSCCDQTQPTIMLHGAEHPIGPAGKDAHGTWGLHVHIEESEEDDIAQKLRDELELAAQRLAGSKGSPPRLADEESKFERKRTHNWAPGTPRDVPPQRQRSRVESLLIDTLPLGLVIGANERSVLTALNEGKRLSPHEVAGLTGADDGGEWMSTFRAKLIGYGLDLIACGEEDGQPFFRLQTSQ